MTYTFLLEKSDNTKILDNIFIGNYAFAMNDFLLTTFKINTIINCSDFNMKSPLTKNKISYYHFPLRDPPLPNDRTFFIQNYMNIIEVISKELNKNKNILIHCVEGLQRSPSVLVAYLIRKKKYTLEKAISTIKSKRKNVFPFGCRFLTCLRQIEKPIQNNMYDEMFISNILNKKFINFKNINSDVMFIIKHFDLKNISLTCKPNENLEKYKEYFPYLSKLFCRGNKIIKDIPFIPSLKLLDISETNIMSIGEYKWNLKNLSCRGNKEIEKIPFIPSLKYLNISYTNIKSLGKYKWNLKELYCQGNKEIKEIPIIPSLYLLNIIDTNIKRVINVHPFNLKFFYYNK